MFVRLALLVFASLQLAGCASSPTAARASAAIADAWPHFLGGLPPDAPPRRGTPEYDKWMRERAAEAARPKNATAK